jgi:hypothetical protein
MLLSQTCSRFANDPLVSPYCVTSAVTPDIFEQFLRVMKGCDIEITEANASALSSLSSEFGFSALSAQSAAFFRSPTGRLTELEPVISNQSDKISSLIGRVERLEAEISDLRLAVAAQAHTQAQAQAQAESQAKLQSESATKRELAAEAALLRADVAVLCQWTVPLLDSQILFPVIFDECRGRSFRLLWRGGRDGFSAAAFHSGCDGHSPTLTVIRDTGGSIFGGFTPIAWESVVWNMKCNSENNCLREDASQKSFVFTVKNPWNTGPKRFPLRREQQSQAVFCYRLYGPVFGYDLPDLSVSLGSGDSSHTKGFGQTYEFDATLAPGIDPQLFLTGKVEFTLAEIEVFEIDA